MTITFESNMASLSLGRHVRMLDDALSILKGFSFNKGKVIDVIVGIGSSLHFHRSSSIRSLRADFFEFSQPDL